jgi:hypothetical protein
MALVAPPYAVDDRSPVLDVHRNRVALAKDVNGAEGVALKDRIREFIVSETSKNSDCVAVQNRQRPTNCRCLSSFVLQDDELCNVVDYLYGYGLLTRGEQQTLVKEWIKYSESIAKAYIRGSDKKRTVYLLPGTAHLVCRDAICLFLRLGKEAWSTIATMARNNSPPSHGLIGSNNRLDAWMQDLLHHFFEDVVKLAQPRATLIVRSLVRDEVVTQLRQDDEDIVELPSNLTKRSLYNRMVKELGWEFTYDAKSKIIERNAIEGMEQERVPCWYTFRQYWKKNYPKLFVASAREDVCNQCYVFANRHRFASKSKASEEDTPVAEDECVAAIGDNGPPEEDEENEEDEAVEMVRNEDLVLAAAMHVEAAQRQRLLYQQKRSEAIATKDATTTERVLCYVADYAQNMYLPNFASEQPGATYYYSPMSCYCFGVVDASRDHLSAWLYTEDVAKKGGNNVASLLMHHLDHQQVTTAADATGPFKEINFVFDNCGGQNKNRQVLRLLHFLVKRRVTLVARAIFLVRGHTKNACDRLFNTMKKQYRKVNCFTPEDLIKSIEGNAQVTPFMVADGVFKDWDALENTLIKKLPGGNTNKNHIFTVDAAVDNGNSMILQASNGAEKTTTRLVLNHCLLQDDAFWKQQQPADIPLVGLPDIKWKELHHKWGTYVPQEKKQQWRYYKEAPPKEKVKEIAEQSKQARQQRKRRTRTVHEQEAKKPKAKPRDDNKDPDGTTGII